MTLNNPLELLSLNLLGAGLTICYHKDGEGEIPGRYISVTLAYAVGSWSKHWVVSR